MVWRAGQVQRVLASFAVAGAMSLLGCSKVFLQDDGFEPKVKAGCATEDSCRRLQTEAAQRILRCQENAIGYVRCADARADKLLADSYVAHYDEAQREKEGGERRREAEQRSTGLRERDIAFQHQQQAALQASEHERATREMQSISRTLERCDSSEQLRTSRRKHEEMMHGDAAATSVRKQCAPRAEMRTVTSDCVDANGFSRKCTKTVPGDVVSYACPKTMDQEVVQLGLFQLGMLDDYPYPAEQTAGLDERSCQRARARATELQSKLASRTEGEGQ